MGDVERALESLRRGAFVLVYDADGREEETDLAIASEFVTAAAIRTLRKEAGGLICATVSGEVRLLLAAVGVVDQDERPASKGFERPFDVSHVSIERTGNISRLL